MFKQKFDRLQQFYAVLDTDFGYLCLANCISCKKCLQISSNFNHLHQNYGMQLTKTKPIV